MAEWLEKTIWCIYLGGLSRCDIRRKAVPVWTLLVGGLLAAGNIIANGWGLQRYHVTDFMPGLLLLLLTKVTKAVGIADGIVLVLLGSLSGEGSTLLLFCISLIYIFIYSMILYVLRYDRKKRIPYIPFLLLAYITMWMM